MKFGTNSNPIFQTQMALQISKLWRPPLMVKVMLLGFRHVQTQPLGQHEHTHHYILYDQLSMLNSFQGGNCWISR